MQAQKSIIKTSILDWTLRNALEPNFGFNTSVSDDQELKENVKFAENEVTGNNNVASITIVHKDSLLKSTSVQTDSFEDAAVTKSPKKVTKKGKLIKKPSSESIKDRLFCSKLPVLELSVFGYISVDDKWILVNLFW